MMVQGLDRKISYFKRFRMEIDLRDDLPAPVLPAGYRWEAWDPVLLEQHAEVKFQCFQDEIDATVFPSLSCRQGCLCLMTEISRKNGFQPAATWLVTGPDGANRKRDWRIYADLAHLLIARARKLYAGESLAVELDQTR